MPELKKEIDVAFSHGRVAYEHDYRISKANNVSDELSQYNVDLENNLNGMKPEEYINKLMQPVIDEFNSRQKREDRKINDKYCDYWKGNKKLNRGKTQLVQEVVASIGNHENLGKEFYEDMRKWLSFGEGVKGYPEYEELVEFYKEVLEQFKQQYKHIKVLYATIHFDEEQGTPHMHIGYIGIGENYKQSLSKQVSICNALECDGIQRIENRGQAKDEGYQLKRFYAQVKEQIMRPIAKKMQLLGKEIEPQREPTKHYETDLYRYLKETAEKEVMQEYQDTIETIDNNQTKIKELNSTLTKLNLKKSDIICDTKEKINDIVDTAKDEISRTIDLRCLELLKKEKQRQLNQQKKSFTDIDDIDRY